MSQVKSITLYIYIYIYIILALFICKFFVVLGDYFLQYIYPLWLMD